MFGGGLINKHPVSNQTSKEKQQIHVVVFCPFSLPLGVSSWLPLVIVALRGLFY